MVTRIGVELLWLVALTGVVSSSVFLALTLVAAGRFRRRRSSPAFASESLPSVSLLKPLCGLEPNLEANLASFFQQDYPHYEIVFGTRDPQDPAVAVARAVQKCHPQIPVKFIFSGEPDRPNAKVCSLEKMVAAASADYFVISDSDVHVDSSYIQEVIRPLLQPQAGMVTCLYRGFPTGGIWARLEALGMSVEMTSGVLIADLLEGMKFALGPTMAIRREVLQAVGGVGMLANYCADDYLLGQKVFESGSKVVLSTHVIDHVVLNRSLRASLAHQVRWMKSTRFSRPKGHIGSGLTFALPFGLLALLAGLLSHHAALGWCLFGWTVCNRVLLSIAAGWGVVRDRFAWRDCWLYPVRDLLGFGLWVASFVGTTIVWRGERYRLRPGGKMVRLAAAGETDSRPVAVDSLA